MLDLLSLRRKQYLPSGRVNGIRLAISAVLLLIASCFAGAVLIGLYYFASLVFSPLRLVVPAVVSCGLGWLVLHAVDWSHCRNPRVGAVLGFVCGTLTCLAGYHTINASALYHGGVKLTTALSRFDLVPEIAMIWIRQDRTNLTKRRDSPLDTIMWRVLGALGEFAILAGVPVIAGKRAARRAYSEATQQWFQNRIVHAVPGSGQWLISDLKAGKELAELLSAIQLSPCDPRPPEVKFARYTRRSVPDAATSWMQLEYLLEPSHPACQAAFLTVTEMSARGKQQRLFQQLELLPSEFAAAYHLFFVHDAAGV